MQMLRPAVLTVMNYHGLELCHQKINFPTFGLMPDEAIKKTLTEKQEAFCQRYLIDFNATKAAIDAGYSETGAATEGWRLLRNADIQNRIEEIRKDMGGKFNVTRERIAQELARIGFFDIRQLYTIDGSLKPLNDLTEDDVAAIGGIEVYEEMLKSDDPDEKIAIGVTKKIKVWDKTKALEALNKLMGYNEPDRHLLLAKNITVTIGE